MLGDDPPRDRTSELRVLGFPHRHLGSIQMTTDTALGVTKLVVEDKSQYHFFICYRLLNYLSSPSQRDKICRMSLIDHLHRAICLIWTKDFPTIVFNAKESVEMPFSEFIFLICSGYHHI